MNVKGNQRSQETKKRIQGVFLRLLKKKDPTKISVSEICTEAKIHRTTFYSHYQDVFDLMDTMVREMYIQVIGMFIQEDQMRWDGFQGLFSLVKEHQEFFRAYLDAARKSGHGFQLVPELFEANAEKLYKTMEFATKEELYYHHTFFTAGLTAIIQRWLLNGCVESPEEMSRILSDEYTANKSYFWEGRDKEE